MALEGLVLVHPTDSSKNVTLNGSKWALEEIDLGNPTRRDELISSIDASGSVPYRVAPRDNREVTARLRLIDAATMNAALDDIARLEYLLNESERLAAADPDDPVLDLVRFVYTPADSSYSFSLIVYTGEITDVPKTVTGEDAGFFLRRPVITIRALCDPYAYGAGVTSPARTSYVSQTLSAATAAQSVRVPTSGTITGDVSPWLQVKFTEGVGLNRTRIVAGTKYNEGSVTAVIDPANLTAVSGTVSSGVMTVTSTDWTVAAQLPTQTRTGTFRVYLRGLGSSSTGSVRFTAAPRGSSRRTNTTLSVSAGSTYDGDLGEVSMDSSWIAWIETKGSIRFTGVILVPTDSFVDVVQATPGTQMIGAILISDDIVHSTTNTNAEGRALTGTNAGTWTGVNVPSPYSSTTGFQLVNQGAGGNGAIFTERKNMGSPQFLLAGSRNFTQMSVNGHCRFSSNDTTSNYPSSGPVNGFVVRYVDSSNYCVAGWAMGSSWNNFYPGFWKVKAGVRTALWTGATINTGSFAAYSTGNSDWAIQTLSDGRWSVTVSGLGGGNSSQTGGGIDFDLVEGATLGNTSAAKVGIFHFFATNPTSAVTSQWNYIRVHEISGLTDPPLPASSYVTFAGPKLLTSYNSEHPYTGSSGLSVLPSVANNLTFFIRRNTDVAASGAQASEDITLDVNGWSRFLSVPHGSIS